MTLPAGTRIGAYELSGVLGAGGMGEVYRARDTKLGRDVALKVLPASLAGDPDRLARFHREAQVLAALNHPNIAQIYGFEDSHSTGSGQAGATHALVMELVDGPTLADLIDARQPEAESGSSRLRESVSSVGPRGGGAPRGIKIDDALAIARQIATALEAAHDAGIVHRDLKPANVKVKDDGTVKVLDFGLAKALDPTTGTSGDVMNSPTLTARATQLGTILGTAAYMAPEQAKGKAVDRRADIWAFGVVLFEMLAGQRAFKGDDVSDVLAAVLRQEIDWQALPADTPGNVRRVLARCLERDPKRRLRDIGDVWIGMDAPDAQVTPAASTTAAPAATPTSSFMRWLPWAALVLVAAGSAAWVIASRSTPEPRFVTRTAETMPGTATFLTIAPDGTRLAYATAGERGAVSLSLRMLDQFKSGVVAGTEGGIFALFSPGGDALVFSGSGDTKIRKIVTTGGTAMTVCDGSLQNGGAWGDDNTLIFSSGKGLMRVSTDSGSPEPITAVDTAKGEIGHVRPQFLPGGRQVLFTVMLADGPQFAVHELGKPGHRLIARGGLNGKYVSSGHLTFVRGTSLIAVPFDPSRLEVLGAEVPVVENVSVFGPRGTADYAVSSTGVLSYFSSPASDGTVLAWADRVGTTRPLPGQSRKGWGTGRLSPDGHTVANAIDTAKGGRDIWTYDVERGTLTQLTFGGQGEVNDFPIFSHDGRRVFYSGVAAGKSGLYAVPTDASGRPSLLLAADSGSTPSSVSTDGKWLLFNRLNAEKRQQIMVLDLTSTATPQAKPLHDAISVETQGQFSRDGKWVAYTSEESGAQEMYVVPFPGPGAKVKVSLEGGQAPRWSVDGKELLYWASQPTSKLMTVEFTTAQGFRPGEPKELFRQLSTTTWDVSPDKNKFLVELSSRTGGTTLAIVTNWFEELRRRAPARK